MVLYCASNYVHQSPKMYLQLYNSCFFLFLPWFHLLRWFFWRFLLNVVFWPTKTFKLDWKQYQVFSWQFFVQYIRSGENPNDSYIEETWVWHFPFFYRLDSATRWRIPKVIVAVPETCSHVPTKRRAWSICLHTWRSTSTEILSTLR